MFEVKQIQRYSITIEVHASKKKYFCIIFVFYATGICARLTGAFLPFPFLLELLFHSFFPKHASLHLSIYS